MPSKVRHFGYLTRLGDLSGWYISVYTSVPTHGMWERVDEDSSDLHLDCRSYQFVPLVIHSASTTTFVKVSSEVVVGQGFPNVRNAQKFLKG
ncbi:hypothetical protein BHE74_00012154 [Ensete ventricosum]|uniref:Uncharacterized protein n=1 Tax=Ensete ventricosum TaxID=4639 RepID=A0A444FY76_ENSVE|nr:hypothetical protein B296_00026513 [Ensete ventricosum]RWW27569.1 hypothetical protein GW17_00007999 [Ensete ventricosum]RWW79543.1 hypothetical protein BHE74_00012154 [Ensete ventricosum]RZR98116.1 hypothetical protein BHM03_00027418 [Ensete ventricosum]